MGNRSLDPAIQSVGVSPETQKEMMRKTRLTFHE